MAGRFESGGEFFAGSVQEKQLASGGFRDAREHGTAGGAARPRDHGSLFLTESKTNLATLRSLRALGVGIAMDEFGIGYSGLSYLRAFPFDKIKIDRSFISELGESADCMAIIKAVTNLGSTLGIPILAEGAETEKQLARLRQVGCTEMQGYLFSQPIPASEIAGLLSSRRNCRQTNEYLLTA